MSRNFSSLNISREQIAVVVSGIVSMGLEILAGRVLAPEFGSSIYTWGSIIGVSMLALSLGYHYGGKSSSNIESRDLERYLIYTSGYIIMLLFTAEIILTTSSALPISPRYAALVPVTILFGPPTYFLGYISPYAVQLSPKQRKGEASGHFYALGTAGSIIGAFGTTFVLIPSLRVEYIYILFAVLAFLPSIRRLKDYRTLLVPFIVVSGVMLSQQSAMVEGDVIYTDSTAYQDLKVAESDGVRTLYLENQKQSAIYTDGREGYVWDYPRYFHIPYLMRDDDIENVLFIGGGGFVSPQKFAEDNVTVHAVEIDPGVIRAAEDYFNLTESSNLKVYNMDGREFLEQSETTYDVIYVDAYRKSQVPFHLTTQEFVNLTHRKTDENGIVMFNTISTASGSGSEFALSQYKTVDSVYNSAYYFPTRDTALAQNIEVMGSKDAQMNKEQLLERARNHSGLNLTEEVSNLQEPETGDVPLLTDSYAPVDSLLDPLVGQKYVVS